MDFTLDETQQDLRTLTADLLAKDPTWPAMEQAGLAAICTPEEGLGAVEMAVVLREVGAAAVDVPALPVLAATLAMAAYGRQVEGLPTVAVKGMSAPYAQQATHVLYATDEGLFLTDDFAVTPEFTSTGEPSGTIMPGRSERLAGPGHDLRKIVTVAVAAQAGGVLAGALKLTTDYIKTRKQFGRPLAEFQAVTMQIADVYIASRALDVAMWSAAWGMDGDDAAIAGFHVSEAFKALFTCQHLHGGLGLDVTYPLHRYFGHAKHLSHLLGGADAQLDLIGAHL
ncbi:acyl-CoA dehydrogenase family protein [Nonomuraea sp. NPDC049152]|uniref:acyl-CoA dehydrogenase family protein n=1 Tax=Nonomuraea sp. NPDC049152 TaxID=3154350 RepID=UPI0033CF9295